MWQEGHTFGAKTLYPYGFKETSPGSPVFICEDEIKTIKDNISQNITRLADRHPDITFYYFLTPYSAEWWRNKIADGTIYKQIEAEKEVIKLILPHKNIKLFGFANRMDITGDLNNYKDSTHYGEWINTLILQWMYEDKYLLTEDNYQSYIDEELNNYLNFDYSSLANQTDYENDYYVVTHFKDEMYDYLYDNYALRAESGQ